MVENKMVEMGTVSKPLLDGLPPNCSQEMAEMFQDYFSVDSIWAGEMFLVGRTPYFYTWRLRGLLRGRYQG